MFQPKKLLMAQSSDDPTFSHLHTDFDLGLVPRAIGTCRYNSHAVVHGHLLVRWVEIRIIAAGTAYTSSRVIGNQQSRRPAEIFKGVDVAAEPGRQLLISCGFGIGIRTRA